MDEKPVYVTIMKGTEVIYCVDDMVRTLQQ